MFLKIQITLYFLFEENIWSCVEKNFVLTADQNDHAVLP